MTYQELCSFDTLWTAYHRARRCKRGKKSTAPFEYSAIEELLILSKSLLQGTHQPDRQLFAEPDEPVHPLL